MENPQGKAASLRYRTRKSGFKRPKILAAICCTLFASGCATAPGTGGLSLQETFASADPCSNNARNIGILAGAVAGAIIGNQINHSNTSRMLGTAVGGLVGGLIGAEIDQRRCELYKIAQRNNLEMRFEDIKVASSSSTEATSDSAVASEAPQTVGMKVMLKDNGRQFESGTDKLNPEAATYFQEIAGLYSYPVQRRFFSPKATKEEIARVEALRDKRILLVGHTDDMGNSSLNADLSERRAQAVARIFRDRGVPEDHIFYQGAGETLPIGDNRTEDGRARNRRVEIVDLSDDKALEAYLASRKPVLSYYRTTPARQGEPAANTALAQQQPATKTRKKAEPAAKLAQGTGVTASGNGSLPTADNGRATARQTASQPNAVATPETWRGIDFGGEPFNQKTAAVDIGKLPSNTGSFSLISSAQADEPLAASCTQDRPRISHGVKSLRDNQEISTRNYLPGLYDSAWAGTVNGHLVALTHVAVLRDGGVPARRPQLLLYPDYKGDSSAKPSYTASPEVNSYQGEKGVLYRVFVNGPMQCLDIVVPNNKPTEAAGSRLFYNRGRELYLAAFNPKLAK